MNRKTSISIHGKTFAIEAMTATWRLSRTGVSNKPVFAYHYSSYPMMMAAAKTCGDFVKSNLDVKLHSDQLIYAVQSVFDKAADTRGV